MAFDGKNYAAFAGRVCILALLMAGGTCTGADAQLLDDLSYRVRVSAAAGTAGGLPFWLHTNQYGVVDPTSANTVVEFSVHAPFDPQKTFSYSYGADVVGRVSDNSDVQMNTLYMKLKLGWLQLNAGRVREKLGVHGGDLSSGPFLWSGNSRPMYKVSVFLNDYVPVPFTRELISLKGDLSHGWFGNDRFVRDAYLHQKSVFARLGGDLPVNVFAGLMHYAMWGGTSEALGDLPSGLRDLRLVFMGDGGDMGAPGAETSNRLGNHLGVWELGGKIDIDGYDILLHKTTPFEDKSGLRGHSPEDGLYGIRLQRKEPGGVIDGVLYELLYTKWQSGPDAPDDSTGSGVGWDNYFNNVIYRDGWTYGGRILGTPLFTYDPLRPFNPIFNNRVVAHHLGLKGSVFSSRYTFFYTYSRNYGTYSDLFDAQSTGADYRFDPPLEQHSVMLRWNRPVTAYGRVFFLDATVAADIGELREDGIGLAIGVTYTGIFGM